MKQIPDSRSDADPVPLTRYLPQLLIGFATFAAIWGIYIVYALYTKTSLSGQMAHVPFWILFGAFVVALNYIPLAKAKPNLIPTLGIVLTIGTTLWFCVNNLFDVSTTQDFVGRLQLDMSLVVSCYCVTHISLMLLTHREDENNYLLKTACVAVAISGLSYVIIFSGMAGSELVLYLILTALAFFFIKFALTVAVIILHVSRRGMETPHAASTSMKAAQPPPIQQID